MDDLDRMLDRLSLAPTVDALATIDGDVMIALADRRVRRMKMRTLCSVAIVGLLIGTGGTLLTPRPAPQQVALVQPPALAPSALLAMDAR